jgi:hypothetical protein
MCASTHVSMLPWPRATSMRFGGLSSVERRSTILTDFFELRTLCHAILAMPEYVMLSIVYAAVAAGADLDIVDGKGISARQLLELHQLTVGADRIELARRDIAKTRLNFVRYRALQICIGLQSRGLDALQMSEILLHACGPIHQWWKIATTVKHFH